MNILTIDYITKNNLWLKAWSFLTPYINNLILNLTLKEINSEVKFCNYNIKLNEHKSTTYDKSPILYIFSATCLGDLKQNEKSFLTLLKEIKNIVISEQESIFINIIEIDNLNDQTFKHIDKITDKLKISLEIKELFVLPFFKNQLTTEVDSQIKQECLPYFTSFFNKLSKTTSKLISERIENLIVELKKSNRNKENEVQYYYIKSSLLDLLNKTVFFELKVNLLLEELFFEYSFMKVCEEYNFPNTEFSSYDFEYNDKISYIEYQEYIIKLIIENLFILKDENKLIKLLVYVYDKLPILISKCFRSNKIIESFYLIQISLKIINYVKQNLITCKDFSSEALCLSYLFHIKTILRLLPLLRINVLDISYLIEDNEDSNEKIELENLIEFEWILFIKGSFNLLFKNYLEYKNSIYQTLINIKQEYAIILSENNYKNLSIKASIDTIPYLFSLKQYDKIDTILTDSLKNFIHFPNIFQFYNFIKILIINFLPKNNENVSFAIKYIKNMDGNTLIADNSIFSKTLLTSLLSTYLSSSVEFSLTDRISVRVDEFITIQILNCEDSFNLKISNNSLYNFSFNKITISFIDDFCDDVIKIHHESLISINEEDSCEVFISKSTLLEYRHLTVDSITLEIEENLILIVKESVYPQYLKLTESDISCNIILCEYLNNANELGTSEINRRSSVSNKKSNDCYNCLSNVLYKLEINHNFLKCEENQSLNITAKTLDNRFNLYLFGNNISNISNTTTFSIVNNTQYLYFLIEQQSTSYDKSLIEVVFLISFNNKELLKISKLINIKNMLSLDYTVTQSLCTNNQKLLISQIKISHDCLQIIKIHDKVNFTKLHAETTEHNNIGFITNIKSTNYTSITKSHYYYTYQIWYNSNTINSLLLSHDNKDYIYIIPLMFYTSQYNTLYEKIEVSTPLQEAYLINNQISISILFQNLPMHKKIVILENDNWEIIGKNQIILNTTEDLVEINLIPIIDGFIKLPYIKFYFNEMIENENDWQEAINKIEIVGMDKILKVYNNNIKNKIGFRIQ